MYRHGYEFFLSDLYKYALFGIYRLGEVLQNFISVHAASILAIQLQVSVEKFNHLIKWDQQAKSLY